MLFKRIFGVALLSAVVACGGVVSTVSKVQAEIPGEVSVGGATLVLINFFDQDNKGTGPDRNQFDFAVNLDFEWKILPNVTVVTQLQGGTGGGSFGFQGPEPAVTDLNVTFTSDQPNLSVTVGSFDTPFGEETANLTNNAGAFGNAFILNSLFYSSFGGQVGTLNTLGVMGTMSMPAADLTLAVTNGTDEGAHNPDGNFEWVISAGTSAILDGLRLAGSYMQSDDAFDDPATTDDPATAEDESLDFAGFGADFQGWMVDGSYQITEGSYIKGYVGGIEFDDSIAATKDDVGIWMGEVAYGQGPWQLAFRLSGWDPDDDDGAGVKNGLIPNPGLSSEWDEVDPRTDQSVQRLQAGGSWRFTDALVMKALYVKDDYDKEDFDMDGFMLVLNGRF